MKSLVLAALLLQIVPPAGPPRQQGPIPTSTRPFAPPSVEELQQRLDLKLKSEFLTAAPWTTDYELALAEAKKTGKPIFAYFTRSDVAYASCTSLEEGLLKSADFVKWAKDYILFCHITTQIKERKYEGLLREKVGSGFPTLLFLDATGNVLYRHQTARTVEKLSESGKQALEFIRLQKLAEGGDSEANFQFLYKQLEANLIRPTDFAAKAKLLKGLSEKSQKTLDDLLFEVEIEELFRASSGREQELAAAAAKVLEWYDNKKIPTRTRAADFYYGILIQYARARKDIKIFELAIREQEKRWANEPNGKNRVESFRQELEHIKKLNRVDELKAKIAGGDKSGEKDLLLLELELQQLTFADAKARIEKTADFTKEEQTKINEYMADLEIRDITGSAHDRDTLIAGGKRALKFVADGRVPERLDSFQRIWVFIINYASAANDEESLSLAVKNIKDRVALGVKGPKENEESTALNPILQMAQRRLEDVKRKNNAAPASKPNK